MWRSAEQRTIEHMLRLFLFGPPRLERNGRPLTITRRKGLALLAYLAITRQPQSRESLAALLWPEQDQSSALSNLRRDLSRLRRDLQEDILLVDRNTLALKTNAALQVDVLEFEQLIAAAREDAAPQHRLDPAIALYIEEFLAGFHLPDAAAFEEWRFFQAEGLRRSLAEALDQLVRLLQAQGEYEAAIDHARRRLALDNLHEPSHRTLMTLYALAGQPAAALRQYQDCARLLEAELGVTPEAETTALYEAIRTRRFEQGSGGAEEQRSGGAGERRSRGKRLVGDYSATLEKERPESSALAPQPPSPSAPLLPLVGREAELRQLLAAIQQLGNGRGAVVLIEGEPGIGKSRLIEEAMQAAAQQGLTTMLAKCYEAEQSLPYQSVIDLIDQLLAGWPDEAFRAIPATALAEVALLMPELAIRFPNLPDPPTGFDEAGQIRLLRALSQFLSIPTNNGGLVLAIDDFHWADPASRRFFHHLARHIQMAQGQETPLLLLLSYRTEEVVANEELALIIHALKRESHLHHLVLQRLSADDATNLVTQLPNLARSQPELGRWLYQETHGNPFFLISILQCLQEEAGNRQKNFSSAATSPQLMPISLPDALRQAVRDRLRRVSAEARTVLEVAAVFGRRFSFQDLELAYPGGSLTLVDIVENLLARQLLREVEAGRYYDFSHDKIREVVYSDLSAVRRRLLHRAYAVALEEQAPDRAAVLAEHYEKGEVWDKAIHYLRQAAFQAHTLFALGEAVGFYDRAITLAEANPGVVDHEALINLHEHRGDARALAGDFVGATADLQPALRAAQHTGDETTELDLHIRLGMIYRRMDEYDLAQQHLDRALALARVYEDGRRVADTLFHLGSVIWSQGDIRKTREYVQEAVDICRRLGLRDQVAVQAYHGLGEINFLMGIYQDAADYFVESLQLARETGDKGYEAENLYMLGSVNSWLLGAYYEKAFEYVQQAIAISRPAQMDWHTAPIQFVTAKVLGSLGRYDEALVHAHEANAITERIGARYFQTIALDTIGELYREIGMLDKAEAHHSQACDTASETNAGNWLSRIQANLAIDRIRLGRLDGDVESLLQRNLALTLQRGQELHTPRCLEGLVELSLAKGDLHAALDYARQSFDLTEPRGMREAAARACFLRGQTLLQMGDLPAAEAALQDAAVREQQLGRPRLALDIHQALANVYQAQGKEREAAEQEALLKQIAEQLHFPKETS